MKAYVTELSSQLLLLMHFMSLLPISYGTMDLIQKSI